VNPRRDQSDIIVIALFTISRPEVPRYCRARRIVASTIVLQRKTEKTAVGKLSTVKRGSFYSPMVRMIISVANRIQGDAIAINGCVQQKKQLSKRFALIGLYI